MVARIAFSLAMIAALAGTAQAQTHLIGQVSYPDRVQLGRRVRRHGRWGRHCHVADAEARPDAGDLLA